MFHQHLADEDQADALTVRFGRKEWGKQLGFHVLADALAIVGYFEHER